MSSKNSKIISLIIPAPLLMQVDQLAKRDFSTRSDLIRRAVVKYVRDAGISDFEITSPEVKKKPPKPKPASKPKTQKHIDEIFKRVVKKHPGIYRDDIELLEFLDECDRDKL